MCLGPFLEKLQLYKVCVIIAEGLGLRDQNMAMKKE